MQALKLYYETDESKEGVRLNDYLLSIKEKRNDSKLFTFGFHYNYQIELAVQLKVVS